MWAVGCTMIELIMTAPVFTGNQTKVTKSHIYYDQIIKIFNILGTYLHGLKIYIFIYLLFFFFLIFLIYIYIYIYIL